MTIPISISLPPRAWTCSGSSTKPLKLRKKAKLMSVARTNSRCAKMGGDTRDYRMLTTDALLRAAVSGPPDDLTLTLDPAFQGLPDTAHGGTLLALFDALARRTPTRQIVGHYRRRVPLGVPLKLTVAPAAEVVACRVQDTTGTVLVEGHVEAVPWAAAGGTAPGPGLAPLPVSRTCF